MDQFEPDARLVFPGDGAPAHRIFDALAGAARRVARRGSAMRVAWVSLAAACVSALGILARTGDASWARSLDLVWIAATTAATVLGAVALIRGPRRARGLGLIALAVSLYQTLGLIAYLFGFRD